MSNTTALDAISRKVIPGKFVTKRDGSPMRCTACAATLVMGETFAAKSDDGWVSYCATCAASFPAFVRGLFGRVTALATEVGTEVPAATVDTVRAVIAQPDNAAVFTTCVDALMAARRTIGAARKATATPDGLDLSAVPSGTYAVPGGDTRLKVKIDNVTKGKWAGWVFVKDGAEYGQGQRYGSQRPGASYKGAIEDALRVIAADPIAAMAAYGHLTNTCGKCGRPLEDAESVARGIGPVCWGRMVG